MKKTPDELKGPDSNHLEREKAAHQVSTGEEYDVLISYSRKNIEFARKIEARLKAYRPPAGLRLPRRYLRVFRDENDLTGAEYHEAIDRALRTSEKLLVLCSPQAKSSDYVNDEIKRFAKHKGAKNIISVLLAGVPNNEVRAGKEDDAAFPEALCAAMEVPLAIDYSNFDTRRDKIDRGVFYGSWYSVISEIFDISRAAIEQRDLRRRRQQRLTVTVTVVVIMAVLVGLSMWALRERAEAERQRDNAIEQAKVATAGRLASGALLRVEEEPDLAHLLAVRAWEHADTFEVRHSLLWVLQTAPRLRSFLNGHAGLVHTMALRPDGAELASADDRGSLRFWNLANDAPVGVPIPVPRRGGIAYSPNGNFLAVAASDGHVQLLDAKSHDFLGPPWKVHTEATLSVAFDPGGALLASGGGDGTIRISDVQNRAALDTPLREHSGSVLSIDFSSDGRVLASAGVDKKVVFWDVSTMTRLGQPLVAHTRSVYSVRFSPDDHILASTSYDGEVRLWRLADIENPELLEEPVNAHMCCGTSLSFSDDGRILASGAYDGTIRLWDPRSGQAWGETDAVLNAGPVHSLAFVPDSWALISGEGGGRIRQWDLTRRPETNLSTTIAQGIGGPFRSVAISPDGSLLAGTNGGNTANVWRLPASPEPTDPVASLKPHARPATRGPTRAQRRSSIRIVGAVRTVAFHPDGKLLALGTDEQLSIWDVATWQPIALSSAARVLANRIAFSPDGSRLVTAGFSMSDAGIYSGEIRQWNVSGDVFSKSPDQTIDLPAEGVMGVAFSPDGSLLATGGFRQTGLREFDSLVNIWDVATMRKLSEDSDSHVDWVSDIAFDHSGGLLVSGGFDHSARLWVVRPGGELQPGAVLLHEAPVLSVAFSFGGDLVATGDDGGNVRLWDIRNATRPEQIASPLRSRDDPVFDLVFARNDGLLVSASERRIRFWDIDPESWAATARRRANRAMTESERDKYVGVDLLNQ